MAALTLHPDRFFPGDVATRRIARDLFARVEHLPLISPHGHADAGWFARDEPFADATSLLLWPDHYLLRTLYSHGIELEEIGVGNPTADRRAAWKLFATHYHVFRGTPSRLWLDHVFAQVFGMDVRLTADTADFYFDTIGRMLATPAFRPRALFQTFKIEKIATTEGALDALADHDRLAQEWPGRVITTYRPDDVIDPDQPNFVSNVETFCAGQYATSWSAYLKAHRDRRAFFRARGATATDHGHLTAQTADLSSHEAQALFDRLLSGRREPGDAELFRAQMLTAMAEMSCEDGMVMQLHAGPLRNHNKELFSKFGPDKGGDLPSRTEYVRALKPLLDRFGNRRELTLILFSLDPATYARELAPLAGHYPSVKLGPAWWFHDSPDGMLRFRRETTETAGFYNLAGFNDDTRAFLSIAARHDLARRIDASYLAELVATHRLDKDEAEELIVDLAYNFPKAAYKL